MKYRVNIDAAADLPTVLAALSSLGTVTQPFTRTPRHIELGAAPGLRSQIEAIAGVCGCCGADDPVDLTLIELVGPGRWNLGNVSGPPNDQYGRDTGQFYLCDVPPNAALIPDCQLIYNPSSGFGDHGTGTADQARRVWPHVNILAVECFAPDGTGTVATVAAGLDAMCNHREDFMTALQAVASMSFTNSGATNPWLALMDRARSLNILMVASSGNAGGTPALWPARDADLSVGSFDEANQRSSFSNYPADIYAGGEACDFLQANGSTIIASGTSISCPLVAMSLRRAIDEGRDMAWLLSQSRTGLTNLLGGDPGLILHYPTQEVFTPPPPPPPPPTGTLGDTIMQLLHVGAPQTVATSQNVDVAWETASGVFQTSITIPAGWTVARAAANLMSKSLPVGKKVWVYVTDAAGTPVAGGRKSFDGWGSTEHYFGISTLAFPVAEGQTYKVVVWHNGGSGVKVNERGDAQLGFELEQLG